MVWSYILIIVGFLFVVIEEATKQVIIKTLKLIYGKVNFRFRIKSYAEPKFKNIYKIILKINGEEESVMRDCEYREVEEINKKTMQWGIIQLKKGIRKEDLDYTIDFKRVTIFPVEKREEHLGL